MELEQEADVVVLLESTTSEYYLVLSRDTCVMTKVQEAPREQADS